MWVSFRYVTNQQMHIYHYVQSHPIVISVNNIVNIKVTEHIDKCTFVGLPHKKTRFNARIKFIS
jgi:hypothetical protein